MARVDQSIFSITARSAACRLILGCGLGWAMTLAPMAPMAIAADVSVAGAPPSVATAQGPAAAAMAAQLADEHAASASGSRSTLSSSSLSSGVVPETSATELRAAAAIETSATVAAPLGASQPVGDPHDPTYLAFGGKDGIRKIINDLYAELLVDPRTKSYFDGAPIERIESLLTDQICSLLNGPCVYTGRSMRQTHAGQNINRAAFNALVEDLEDAMDKHGVPYRYQTRLLAKLAPMYRDVQDRP